MVAKACEKVANNSNTYAQHITSAMKKSAACVAAGAGEVEINGAAVISNASKVEGGSEEVVLVTTTKKK